MIIGIVAVAQNLAIGRGGKLPWHYTEDLKFFKRTTIGQVVAMGSTTWKAIGKPLPERLNIVLSRKAAKYDDPNAIGLSSIDQVIELSKYIQCNIYIIGGAKVYESLGSVIDEWLVTDIPLTIPDADTFMPEDFLYGFTEVEHTTLPDGLIVRRLRR